MGVLDVNMVVFLVSGVLMIAVTISFGVAMTIEQIRTNGEKPQAGDKKTTFWSSEKL